MEVVDVSTPRSIERWLTADEGCAVGIDVTPKRFVDPVVRRRLDCVTDIPGLYLTGQDTVVVGVTLSQVWLFILIVPRSVYLYCVSL